MDKMLKELIGLLVSKSLQVAPSPVFKLASGKTSNVYIDCRKTTFNAKGKRLIGSLIFDRIQHHKIDAIGGLMLGAVPVADAVSQFSADKGKLINAFAVRATPKEHGLKKVIEGDIHKGDRVVIVDDVATTGGSTITAIRAARDFGLDIVKVIVLVDRQEGGRENILKEGVDFEAIITKQDLLDEYNRRAKGSGNEGSLPGQPHKLDPALRK